MKKAEKQICLWSERRVLLVEIMCFILTFVNSDQLGGAQCFSISFFFFFSTHLVLSKTGSGLKHCLLPSN